MVNQKYKKHLFLSRTDAFTLIEIAAVLIIFGILAALVIPQYQRTLHKSAERDMMSQLTAIHAMQKIYFGQAEEYWDPPGADGSVSVINAGLGLNLIESDQVQYLCATDCDGTNYVCRGLYSEATDRFFRYRITESAIDPGNNPCCEFSATGSCPTPAYHCPVFPSLLSCT